MIIDHHIPVPEGGFEEKTDLEIRATASTGTIDVSAGVDFLVRE